MPRTDGSRKWLHLPIRIHYAWIILIAGAIAFGMSGEMSSFVFGPLLVPMSAEMGWTRSQVSLAYTLMFVGFSATSLIGGWLADTIGARRTLLLSSIALASSIMLTGRASHLWELYLYFGMFVGGARGLFTTSIYTVVTLWFRKRLGLATGILVSSTGLIPLVLTPLLGYVIDIMGWGNALILLGIIGGGTVVVCCSFIRNQPSDVGTLAYGATLEYGTTAKASGIQQGIFYKGDEPDFFKHARQTPPFRLLPIIHCLGCISHAVILAHIVAIGIDTGLPPVTAASILGLIGGFSVASRFGIPILADIVGGKKAMTLGIFLQASVIPVLLVTKEPWMFYVFAVLFGIGYGGEMSAFPVINRQYYGSAPIGRVLGYQMMLAGIGMGIGGYLGGLCYDLMGNYTLAIWMASLVGFLTVAVTLILPSPVKKVATDALSANN
ncbi:MFS transporter [Chloroflexota bacterium]